jgi:hypothetical protein
MSERRENQCHCEGCDSEAIYGTKLFLDVAAPGVRYPIRMNGSIKVCEQHKSEPSVRAYYLNDRNRETIITHLTEAGHPEPDFLTAKIIFEPMEVRHSVLLAAPPLTCDREGCKRVARWQVKQRFRMFWQKGKGEPQVEALTNIVVCDHHKPLTTASHFKDPESLKSTRAWLNSRGVSMPDLKTSEIAFEPIDGKRLDRTVFVGGDGPREQFSIDANGNIK